MRGGKTLVLMVGLLLSVSASANDVDGTAKPVVQHRHTQPSAAVLQQRVAKHEAEVQKLQQDVSKQEQASKQANEHLQQQDQAIAELQKQLQEVRAKPAAGGR